MAAGRHFKNINRHNSAALQDTLVGINDVIIQSKFGFNILRGFRSTVGRNFRFPLTLLVIVTTVLPLPRSL